MSEDEFNAAMAGARQAQSGLGGVLSGLGAGNVSTPSMAPTGAANGQSINGLGGYSMPSWVTPADIQTASLLSQQAPLLEFSGCLKCGELHPACGDAYGEQGPDTDGLGAYRDQQEAEIYRLNGAVFELLTENTQLTERIARKEAANEALVAKLGATLADMCSLQRQSDNWRAECQRLSALLVETQQELARRMAMPANALRHGGVR